MRYGRLALGIILLAVVAGILFLHPNDPSSPESSSARSQDSSSQKTSGQSIEVMIGEPVIPGLTGPARDLPPYSPEPTLDREINPRQNPYGTVDPEIRIEGGPDPLLELQENAAASSDVGFSTPIYNFDGQGYTYLNPPDTVGDVGTDHYIQMINSTGVAVYDKHTGSLTSSFDLTSLGGCSTGRGDPIVLFDHAADRWFLSEFGLGSSLCIFISTTSDPLGTYYWYKFDTPYFPDYPKYAVWSDGYYATTNESSLFQSYPSVYALDRTKMLVGLPATYQRFTAPSLDGFGFQALTPADWDGIMPPPASTPGYFMRHVDTEAHGPENHPNEDYLEVWAFDVDWSTPGNSSFTKITDVSVAEFDSDLCGLASLSGIAMPGVSKCSGSSLDPLREIVMWRLQYRNFGSHETLVGNLATDVTGNDDSGVRWFELRKVGAGGWTLFQEGTYAPDSDSRWMGAIAMDGAGNIALGYNVSSSSTYPSLRYAGRLASDAPGTLPQGEHILVDGSNKNGSNRYGDYSAMSVDPVDDCTFWFTGEYNASSQWSTRIGAFKFDSCVPDFTLVAAPISQAVCAGVNANYEISVGSVFGYSDPVTVSASGNPDGTSTNFSVNPVIPEGNSILTVSSTESAAAGQYTVEIMGVAPTSTHTTTVGLELFDASPGSTTLLTPVNEAINQPTHPIFSWTDAVQSGSYEIEIATDPAFNNTVISDTVSGTSYALGTDLNTSTTYYWHVRSINACGEGIYSAVFRFTTTAAPGDCGPGYAANIIFSDDFESGAPGWSTGGDGSTWALDVGASPGGPHSGVFVYHADDVNVESDQYLISPAFSLPNGQSSVSLKFWNYQEIESSTSGCYDAGVLEVSNNGGTSWTRIESELLTDPYDGVVSSGFSNPLAAENAWCGDPQEWLNSVVDISSFAGQTVQFRWRLATDNSMSRPGWDVDDVIIQSCQPATLNVPTYLPLIVKGMT